MKRKHLPVCKFALTDKTYDTWESGQSKIKRRKDQYIYFWVSETCVRKKERKKISLHEKLRLETLVPLHLTIAWCGDRKWSLPTKECTLNCPTYSLIGQATIGLLCPGWYSLSFSCSSPSGIVSITMPDTDQYAIRERQRSVFDFAVSVCIGNVEVIVSNRPLWKERGKKNNENGRGNALREKT